MDIEVTDNLEFGRITPNRSLFATLYRPKASQPLPLIIWIHGGGWRAGTRHDDEALHRQIVLAGFACLSIDYRLTDEAIFPATLQDCKCAVRYARANAEHLNIAPEKIGAWGPSAGGHLAALLGTSAGVMELEGDSGWSGYSSDVQAVCDWFGPTDLLRMNDFSSDIDHNAPDSPESMLVGGAIQQHPERGQKANPITYVSAATPPMLIAHGKRDTLVPFNQSERLYKALVAYGVEAVFETLENGGHGGAGFEPDSALVGRCIEFFRQYL